MLTKKEMLDELLWLKPKILTRIIVLSVFIALGIAAFIYFQIRDSGLLFANVMFSFFVIGLSGIRRAYYDSIAFQDRLNRIQGKEYKAIVDLNTNTTTIKKNRDWVVTYIHVVLNIFKSGFDAPIQLINYIKLYKTTNELIVKIRNY